MDILELVEDGWESKLRLPSPVLVNHRDKDYQYQLYDDDLELVRGVEVETSFIHMGSFWVPPNGYLTAKKKTPTTINGFLALTSTESMMTGCTSPPIGS